MTKKLRNTKKLPVIVGHLQNHAIDERVKTVEERKRIAFRVQLENKK